MELKSKKLKVKNKSIFVLCATSLILFGLCGCASLRENVNEAAKELLGVSTKLVEDNRSTASKDLFLANFDTCFDKSLVILKDIRTYIYAKDKNKKMIAVYLSETETTPVGIFFSSPNDQTTQIEVSSPSDPARESVATRLFTRLLQALNPPPPENKNLGETSQVNK